MRPVLSALLLLLALPLSAPAQAQDKSSTTKDLHALFDAEWERGLRENPVGATYIGDHRFDDRWPDLSPAALQASYEGDKAVIAALDKIDPQQLTPEDQLNRDLFRRQYQANIDTYDYGSQYTPLSQRSGLASMHRMADVVVFKTVKDYEQWLSSHRHDRHARRPEHRLDARRRAARPGAAEDHHAARTAAARQADRRGPHEEPVLRSVQEDAGFDPGRRAGAPAGRRTRCDHEDGRAVVHEVEAVRRRRVPAAGSRYRRPVGHAERRGPLCRTRALLHDDQPDAGRDPRDRPEGSRAHPRRDDEGHRAGRTSRAASTSS